MGLIGKKTKLLFTKNGICESLEEIRKASYKTGLFKINEIELSISPTEDLNAEIKPYKNKEDLQLIKDWKGPVHQIGLDLPLKDKVNKELDKEYGPSKVEFLKEYKEKDFGMFWTALSDKPEAWDYYDLTLSGRSLCDNEWKQINKKISDPDTYNSGICQNCSKELKSYCNDVTSILNKYSLSLQKRIKITNHKEK
jgi:hypothetical protein